MRKAKRDSSVKKSLVRDTEKDISKHVVKLKSGAERSSHKPTRDRSLDPQFHLEYDLTNPKLYTTKMISNQISNIKRKPSPAVNLDDVHPEKPLIAAMTETGDDPSSSVYKVHLFRSNIPDSAGPSRNFVLTKRLMRPACSFLYQYRHLVIRDDKKFNFHVNERVYGNLVEINADKVPERRGRKRSPVLCHSISRDAEPRLEDFCVKKESADRPRILSCARPKCKFVTSFDDDRLHKIFYNAQL